MSKPTEVKIPILTDIIKPGDADMTRHFDAHCFDDAARKAGVPAEKIEELVSELLDEMLPEFKQKLLARLQEKLKA
ncbi:MAG: hypothetical protein HYZ31_09280 [Gammaproteobacteria bacterium]|nr:hypothetical protein [Gammaproteobacteria bacterium]